MGANPNSSDHSVALVAGTKGCASTDAAAAEFMAMLREVAAGTAGGWNLLHARDNAIASPAAGK